MSLHIKWHQAENQNHVWFAHHELLGTVGFKHLQINLLKCETLWQAPLVQFEQGYTYQADAEMLKQFIQNVFERRVWELYRLIHQHMQLS